MRMARISYFTFLLAVFSCLCCNVESSTSAAGAASVSSKKRRINKINNKNKGGKGQEDEEGESGTPPDDSTLDNNNDDSAMDTWWPSWYPRKIEDEKEDLSGSESNVEQEDQQKTKKQKKEKKKKEKSRKNEEEEEDSATKELEEELGKKKRKNKMKLGKSDKNEQQEEEEEGKKSPEKRDMSSRKKDKLDDADGKNETTSIATTNSTEFDESSATNNTTKVEEKEGEEDEDEDDEEEDDDDELEDEDEEETQNNATATSNTTQSTGISLSDLIPGLQQQQQQPQQGQQQGPSLIVMGSPPPPPHHRGSPYHRRTHPPGRQGNNGGLMMGDNNNNSHREATALAITEVLLTVAGALVRVWLITWLAKKLAFEEEIMYPTQHFVWERLNDRYTRDATALQRAMNEPPFGVSFKRWRRILRKRARRTSNNNNNNNSGSSSGGVGGGELPPLTSSTLIPTTGGTSTSSITKSTTSSATTKFPATPTLNDTFQRTVIVFDLVDDTNGNVDLDHMSKVITFLISQHRMHAFGTQEYKVIEQQQVDELLTPSESSSSKKQQQQTKRIQKPVPLEILIKVNSPGGSVVTFGLAASQMQRLTKEEGISTTVCVDKYAASGGYMIASQADKLVAAPFSTIGSIGVIMEGLNFHDILRQYNIKPLVLKAGDSKNPITTLGQVNREDIERENKQLTRIHDAFKQLVVDGRPQLMDIVAKRDDICDGSVYLGQEAKELKLIDDVMTTDEYIQNCIFQGDRVLMLHRSHQSRFGRRFHSLSPLDILPHLIQKGKQSITAFVRDLTQKKGVSMQAKAQWSSFIQTGTFLSLIQYIFQKYAVTKNK